MTVYTKTARGLDEIAHRSNAIGLRARRVLILIDEWLRSISETRLGRNRAQELKERLLAVM